MSKARALADRQKELLPLLATPAGRSELGSTGRLDTPLPAAECDRLVRPSSPTSWSTGGPRGWFRADERPPAAGAPRTTCVDPPKAPDAYKRTGPDPRQYASGGARSSWSALTDGRTSWCGWGRVPAGGGA